MIIRHLIAFLQAKPNPCMLDARNIERDIKRAIKLDKLNFMGIANEAGIINYPQVPDSEQSIQAKKNMQIITLTPSITPYEREKIEEYATLYNLRLKQELSTRQGL